MELRKMTSASRELMLQTLKLRKDIRVIVVPAGCGKSYSKATGLRRFENVKEADSVVDPKETQELRTLRGMARAVADWSVYDLVYGTMLLERLDHKDIRLVASGELGHKIGKVIATAVLQIDIWLESLLLRGSDIPKHRQHYYAASYTPDCIVAKSLDMMVTILETIILSEMEVMNHGTSPWGVEF